MSTNSKLIDRLFKIGFSYEPLFVDDYGVFLCAGDYREYDEKCDVFILNSKIKNGKNSYKEFQKKYYYDRIGKEVYREYKKVLFPVIGIDSYNGERRLAYMNRPIVLAIAEKYGVEFDPDTADVNIDNIHKDIAKELSKRLGICDAFIRNSYDSKSLSEDLLSLGLDKDFVKRYQEEINNPIMLSSLFRESIDEIKKDSELLKSLYSLDINSLNFGEFLSCFDIDKYFLLYSKMVIDFANDYSKANNEFLNIVPQIYNYVHFVEELGLKEYNPKIKYPKDINRKKIKFINYTFNDLKRELKKYLDKFPELSFKYVSAFDPYFDKDIKDMGCKEDIEKEVIKYRYGEEYQNITASWEFIKKGETERRYYSRSKVPSERKTREEIDIDYRMSVFLKTNYICQIIGTDKFTGYRGFIYPNGIITFEKFFDEKDRPIKDSNATYIMNVKNFEYFSSLTKPEIIEYIKETGNEEIDRKYHCDKWEKNLRKIVENPNCDEEMKERVKVIIAEGRRAKKLEA